MPAARERLGHTMSEHDNGPGAETPGPVTPSTHENRTAPNDARATFTANQRRSVELAADVALQTGKCAVLADPPVAVVPDTFELWALAHKLPPLPTTYSLVRVDHRACRVYSVPGSRSWRRGLDRRYAVIVKVGAA